MAPNRLVPNAMVEDPTSRKRFAKIRFPMNTGVKPKRDRGDESQDGIQVQQRVQRNHPRQRDGREQRQVEQARPANGPSDGHLDRYVDGEQDPAEHQRVDEPRRAEQQREPDDVGGLQQQEGSAHEEEIHVRAHRTERPGPHTHEDEGHRQDEQQRDLVEGGDPATNQVREREVVRVGTQATSEDAPRHRRTAAIPVGCCR